MIRVSRGLVFRVVAVAVGVNALGGIIALMSGSGSLGETETRILLTALTLSVWSILMLAPVSAWDRLRFEGQPVVPAISAGATTLATLIILWALWSEPSNDDILFQTITTLAIIGIALGHICLLGLAKRTTLRDGAMAATLLLGAQLLAAVWEVDMDGDLRWRLTGITTIIVIALSILVPVRQWAGGQREAPASSSPRYCPYCGARGEFSAGGGTCHRCGRNFELTTAEATS